MLIIGDCLEKLKELPDQSVNCCVTSPPYWGLRDYGVQGQIGLEETLEEYISVMVAVFREVKRVLRDDGTCWINMGDCYAGSWAGTSVKPDGGGKHRPCAEQLHPRRGIVPLNLKRKDLVGLPWRVAFALQADGWYLRQDIIWAKPNPMPESVRDRCTRAHEYIFLLSKSARYYYDQEAIKEPCVGVEMANGFRGSAYCDHETRDNTKGGKRKVKGNITSPPSWKGSIFHDGKNAEIHPNVGKNRKIKVPSGWETSKDAHGNYHRDGRGEPQYKEFDKSMAAGAPGINGRKHLDYGMKNKRSVWIVPPALYSEAHFATYPPRLVEPCILAGCPPGGTVLDPFLGSGTTAEVAIKHQRDWVGIEINPDYRDLIEKRLNAVQLKIVL